MTSLDGEIEIIGLGGVTPAGGSVATNCTSVLAQLSRFELRERDARPLGTTQKRLRASFEETFADGDLQLAALRLDDDYWKLEIAPGGRLMRLSNGQQGGSVLRFEDKHNSERPHAGIRSRSVSRTASGSCSC